MKILVIILKVILLILTGVCGVVFNVLGAVSMLSTGVAAEKQITGQIIFWLVFSCVCFLTPAFFAGFKKYIIGAGFSFVGMICVIILNEMLGGAGNELYLQLLLITIVSVLLAVFGSWDKIRDGLDRREQRKTAEAPSVLGGTTRAGVNSGNSKKRKK